MKTSSLGTALARVGRALVVMGALSCSSAAQAAWTYTVDVVGCSLEKPCFESLIVSNTVAALDLWTRHLAGGAAIEVEIEVGYGVERAAGSSLTSGFVRHEAGVDVYEQGVAYEIRTGRDPNAAKADLRILLNRDYVICPEKPEKPEKPICGPELWLDPEPAQRRDTVPAHRTDAVSFFAHELGHALAYNGWWHQPAGQVLSHGSPWDLLTEDDGTALYFVGAAATALYGDRVPVTFGNNFHIGNAIGPGSDLVGDLMNGVAFSRGLRYDVSPLNRAMLADMGLPMAPVPEPQTALLLATGLAGLAGRAGWRRWRAGGRAGIVAPVRAG